MIAVRFDGADDLRVDAKGELMLSVGTAVVRHKTPHVYQRRPDGRTDVIQARYVAEKGTVRFDLGAYDRSLPLVIDPVVVFATYLGSSGEEERPRIGSDAAGNVYLLGDTWGPDYPTENAIQNGRIPGGSNTDVVLTKVSPDGELIYSTYLGSPFFDEARDIVVNAAGEPYLLVLCGTAFPDAPGYRFETPGSDAFSCIVKLNASGSGLLFEARISATLDHIALDADGYVGLAGWASINATVPLVNPAQAAGGGQSDAFMLKLNAAGTEVVFSTRLGGNGSEFALGVAFDADGFLYAAGRLGHQNSGNDFPVAGAPVHGPRGGNTDTFLAAYSPTGSKQFSTYLGGSQSDFLHGLAVDADGNIYLAGTTTSTDFPVVNAIKPQRTYTDEAFVCRFAPGAQSLVYSTHLGGGRATGIAVNEMGQAYVVGETPATDLMLRLPFDRTLGGITDAFLFKLGPAGALMHSSYFGGSGPESGISARVTALGPRGSVYIAGTTKSSDIELLNPIQSATGPFHLNNFYLARLSTVAEITGVSPQIISPGVGGPVTISGRNFFGDTRVFVGGQFATTVTIQSLTSLTATMPALPAGNYDVVVINPDGELASLPNGIVYDACTISVAAPATIPFEATGGQRAVTVRPSHPGCHWTASSNTDWVTPVRASGSSTVSLNAGRNLSGTERSGMVTIAGRSFTIIQSALSTLDLNADGRTDVLWWNELTGGLAAWLVSGRDFLGALSFSPSLVPDVRWQPVASGDLDGDRDIDIVWRNIDTGVLVGWLMDGTTMVANGVLGRVDDLSWRPRASGDFTGDGRADLLWQHEGDGRIALWTMNGLENTSAELLPFTVPDTAWHIVGTGDFDRNGRRDLLWRHQAGGQIAVWLMDGRQLIDGRLLPFVVDPVWRIRGVGDVNGDGSADWLWQRTGNGNPVVWLMNGLSVISGGPLGSFDSVDNAWLIAGPR